MNPMKHQEQVVWLFAASLAIVLPLVSFASIVWLAVAI